MKSILVALFFIPTIVLSQEKIVPKHIEGYYELGIKNKQMIEQIKQWYSQMSIFGFEEIDKSKYEFVFRYWTDSSLIEILYGKTSHSGRVVNFAIGEDFNKNESIYVQVDSLGTQDVNLIRHHIDTSTIIDIPSSEEIDDWNYNFHFGGSTKIELYSLELNLFNDYFALENQKKIYESEELNKFAERLSVLSNFKSYRNDFILNLPFYCYTINGVTICNVLTKKEYRRRKRKAKKDYETKN